MNDDRMVRGNDVAWLNLVIKFEFKTRRGIPVGLKQESYFLYDTETKL